MHWVAPSEKDTTNGTLEKRLWDAADQFRANSGLKSQEYSAPVLGLIFLRFAEVRFAAQRANRLVPPRSVSIQTTRGESCYRAEGFSLCSFISAPTASSVAVQAALPFCFTHASIATSRA